MKFEYCGKQPNKVFYHDKEANYVLHNSNSIPSFFGPQSQHNFNFGEDIGSLPFSRRFCHTDTVTAADTNVTTRKLTRLNFPKTNGVSCCWGLYSGKVISIEFDILPICKDNSIISVSSINTPAFGFTKRTRPKSTAYNYAYIDYCFYIENNIIYYIPLDSNGAPASTGITLDCNTNYRIRCSYSSNIIAISVYMLNSTLEDCPDTPTRHFAYKEMEFEWLRPAFSSRATVLTEVNKQYFINLKTIYYKFIPLSLDGLRPLTSYTLYGSNNPAPADLSYVKKMDWNTRETIGSVKNTLGNVLVPPRGLISDDNQVVWSTLRVDISECPAFLSMKYNVSHFYDYMTAEQLNSECRIKFIGTSGNLTQQLVLRQYLITTLTPSGIENTLLKLRYYLFNREYKGIKQVVSSYLKLTYSDSNGYFRNSSFERVISTNLLFYSELPETEPANRSVGFSDIKIWTNWGTNFTLTFSQATFFFSNLVDAYIAAQEIYSSYGSYTELQQAVYRKAVDMVNTMRSDEIGSLLSDVHEELDGYQDSYCNGVHPEIDIYFSKCGIKVATTEIDYSSGEKESFTFLCGTDKTTGALAELGQSDMSISSMTGDGYKCYNVIAALVSNFGSYVGSQGASYFADIFGVYAHNYNVCCKTSNKFSSYINRYNEFLNLYNKLQEVNLKFVQMREIYKALQQSLPTVIPVLPEGTDWQVDITMFRTWITRVMEDLNTNILKQCDAYNTNVEWNYVNKYKYTEDLVKVAIEPLAQDDFSYDLQIGFYIHREQIDEDDFADTIHTFINGKNVYSLSTTATSHVNLTAFNSSCLQDICNYPITYASNSTLNNPILASSEYSFDEGTKELLVNTTSNSDSSSNSYSAGVLTVDSDCLDAQRLTDIGNGNYVIDVAPISIVGSIANSYYNFNDVSGDLTKISDSTWTKQFNTNPSAITHIGFVVDDPAIDTFIYVDTWKNSNATILTDNQYRLDSTSLYGNGSPSENGGRITINSTSMIIERDGSNTTMSFGESLLAGSKVDLIIYAKPSSSSTRASVAVSIYIDNLYIGTSTAYITVRALQFITAVCIPEASRTLHYFCNECLISTKIGAYSLSSIDSAWFSSQGGIKLATPKSLYNMVSHVSNNSISSVTSPKFSYIGGPLACVVFDACTMSKCDNKTNVAELSQGIDFTNVQKLEFWAEMGTSLNMFSPALYTMNNDDASKVSPLCGASDMSSSYLSRLLSAQNVQLSAMNAIPPVRFIADSICGNNINSSNHWTEVTVYTQTNDSLPQSKIVSSKARNPKVSYSLSNYRGTSFTAKLGGRVKNVLESIADGITSEYVVFPSSIDYTIYSSQSVIRLILSSCVSEIIEGTHIRIAFCSRYQISSLDFNDVAINKENLFDGYCSYSQEYDPSGGITGTVDYPFRIVVDIIVTAEMITGTPSRPFAYDALRFLDISFDIPSNVFTALVGSTEDIQNADAELVRKFIIKGTTEPVCYYSHTSSSSSCGTVCATWIDTKEATSAELPDSLVVDLGQCEEVTNIRVKHYYNSAGGEPDGRYYNHHKLLVSSDGTHWYSVYDSDINGVQQETSEGILYIVNQGWYSGDKVGLSYSRTASGTEFDINLFRDTWFKRIETKIGTFVPEDKTQYYIGFEMLKLEIGAMLLNPEYKIKYFDNEVDE